MANESLEVDSLERIVPQELDAAGATGRSTLQLHLERYAFAGRHLPAGKLLDIACGVGYGLHFLMERNPAIAEGHGVDLSAAAIAYAQRHYSHSRVHYFCQDATTFRGFGPYDGIVSLETIEHVPEPAKFFRHLVGLLAPGGVLVASVPATPSMDGNPNHLTDFTEQSFRKLGQATGLREIDCFRQVQPFSASAVALGKEKRLVRTPAQLVGFYLRRPGKVALRIGATLRYGFVNRYITVAWRKDSGENRSPE